MMRKIAVFIPLLFAAACGGGTSVPPAKVSRADMTPAQGMTYEQFRRHEAGTGDLHAAQKRFIMLDRNNNGVLSQDEFSGY